jgi:hypothetical protein
VNASGRLDPYTNPTERSSSPTALVTPTSHFNTQSIRGNDVQEDDEDGSEGTQSYSVTLSKGCARQQCKMHVPAHTRAITAKKDFALPTP